MADVAAAPTTNGTASKAGIEAVDKAHKAKPEKPDDAKYKVDLEKAEKEHAAAQEKLVGLLLPGASMLQGKFAAAYTLYTAWKCRLF